MVDDVKEEHLFLFKRCKRIRDIVNARRIKIKNYIYTINGMILLFCKDIMIYRLNNISSEDDND